MSVTFENIIWFILILALTLLNVKEVDATTTEAPSVQPSSQPSIESTGQPTSEPSLNCCPVGYTLQVVSCYKYVSTGASWSNAKSSCEGDGSHLVTLTSRLEIYRAVAVAGSSNFWFGLEEVSPNDWQWVNSESVVYTNWQKTPDSGKCARCESDGDWKDKDCVNVEGYICEIAPSCNTTEAPSGEPSGVPSAQPSTPSGQPSGDPTSQPTQTLPTAQPTGQPSSDPSATPSERPSGQPSGDPSTQPTQTPSSAPSAQPTGQPSSDPSATPSERPSGQPSGDPSTQPTQTPSSAPSAQPTGQPSSDPSATPSERPSGQPSGDPTTQPTQTPSSAPSAQPTGQPSSDPSATPSERPSGQPSGDPTTQPTQTPSSAPSAQPTGQPSSDPSAIPSERPSGKPSSDPTTQPTQTPSSAPSAQPTGEPSSDPSATPSERPSGQPSGDPTTQPTQTPSSAPSAQPTGQPSSDPSATPSARPSGQPSGDPTTQPTQTPSCAPSAQPTGEPSSDPSATPSGQPSDNPSTQPTSTPSREPSSQPSGQPSTESSAPTAQPTGEPSSDPTVTPSRRPSCQPSSNPTSLPTQTPSSEPSLQPSGQPSGEPFAAPTTVPTDKPSEHPSTQPTNQPSLGPSTQPTTLPSGAPSTSQPTAAPSGQPSDDPTTYPTQTPSSAPSAQPTGQPNSCPTVTPSGRPSLQPSVVPSGKPSSEPTSSPTVQPSSAPSNQPTRLPSSQPSTQSSAQPTEPTSQPSSQPTEIRVPSLQPSSMPSAQQSNFSSEEIMLDIAPEILNITMVTSPEVDVVQFDIILTNAGKVYCGVFPVIGGKLFNVSTSLIRYQDRRNLTLSDSITFSVYNLKETVKYRVYFMTTSVDEQHVMSLQNILANEVEVQLPCTTDSCGNALTVDVRSKNLIVSEYLQRTLAINIADKWRLAGDVFAIIDVVAVANVSSNIVISPHIVPLSSATVRGSVDIYVWALYAGVYNVSVRLVSSLTNTTEIENTDIQVAYPNGQIIEIFESRENFHKPEAVRATFVGDDNEIEVAFDSLTDQAGLEYSIFDCSALLLFPGASSTSCFWRDASTLIISLNGASTLLPGHSITVNVTLIGAESERESTERRLSSSLSKSDRRLKSEVDLVVNAGHETLPKIVIGAPSRLSACSPFVLDLTASSGHMGRIWRNVSIQVRGSSLVWPHEHDVRAILNELNTFYATVYDIYTATELPGGDLIPQFLYVFDIRVCNWFMKCATATHYLTTMSSYVPYLTYEQSDTRIREVERAASVQILPTVLPLRCSGVNDTAVIASVSRIWRMNDPVIASTLITVPLGTESLSLSPYSLSSNQIYEISEVVNVTTLDEKTNVNTTTIFYNLVLVNVKRSPVVAVISTPRQIFLGLNETVTINGGDSYDSNVVSGDDNLHYSWQCRKIGPLFENASSVDCAGFLRVNESFPVEIMISPIFVNSNHMSLLNSEFEVSLTVFSEDMLYFDRAIITATVIGMCCVSVDLQPVAQYNVKDNFRISAQVQASIQGHVSWKIGGINASELQQAALTPVSFDFEGALSMDSGRLLQLVLLPRTLKAGFRYTVSLVFVPVVTGVGGNDIFLKEESLYFSMEVVPNTLPMPGNFSVTPAQGLSMADTFTFQAELWRSDHLPLRYLFGFQSVSSGLIVPVSPLGTATMATNVLPMGNAYLDFHLTGVVRVFDTYDASNVEEVHVKVLSNQMDREALSATIDLLLENENAASVEGLVGPVLEIISQVNCTLAPDCSLYHRRNCSSVPHTCGPCLSDEEYIGEEGHHNSACAKRTDFAGYINDNEVVICLQDADCPPFQKCMTGSCTQVEKQCAANCSSQGACSHVVSASGIGMGRDRCMVGDITCDVECACNSGWFGQDCSRDDSSMAMDSDLRMRLMCRMSSEILNSVEVLEEEKISVWLDQLKILSQQPNSLTIEAALCSISAQSYFLGLMTASSKSYSYGVIDKLLDLASSVLEYRKFYDYVNQTQDERSEILTSVGNILDDYCGVVLNAMVVDQFPIESVKSRLRFMSLILSQGNDIGDNASHAELIFNKRELESFNDIDLSYVSLIPSSTSGWCMYTLDSIVYRDFTDGDQRSNSLTVLSSGADISSDSMESEAPFSATLEDVTGTDDLVSFSRTSHNVTCSSSEYDTILYQKCPHSATHELYCDADSAGVWVVTCPAVTATMGCKTLRASETGIDDVDSGCVTVSLSGTTMVCECPMSALVDETRLRRQARAENGTDSEVDVELVAMVDYVVEDFIATWRSASDLTVENSKEVLVTMGVFFGLIIVCYKFAADADFRDAFEERKKKNNKEHAKKVYPSSTQDDREQSDTAVVDLDTHFPSLVNEDPLLFVFLDEVKVAHRWASFYFSYDKYFTRTLKVFFLSSLTIIHLFFNALLYNISAPDDGSCDVHDSETACLSESSQFSSHDTKCYWKDDMCRFKEPSDSAVAVIYVAMMSAILCVPFLVILEYIVIDVLSHPTAVYAKTHPVMSARSHVANGATILQSMEKANDALEEFVFRLSEYLHSLSFHERSEMEALWGLTLHDLETYIRINQLRPETDESVCRVWSNSDRDIIRPSTTVNGDDIPVSRRSTSIQRKRVTAAPTRSGEFAIIEDVLRDIMSVQAQIAEESKIFSKLTAEEQGIRLLYLLQKDLLSNVPGEFVWKKSAHGKRMVLESPVSYRSKCLGYMFILVMDMWMLFYIFLFAVSQDHGRQSAWLQSFIIWLILEVVIVSSFVMIMSQFVIPSLKLADMKGAKQQMIAAVHTYRSKFMKRDATDDDIDVNEPKISNFNAAHFLHVSTQMASLYPNSVESEIIRDYSTTMPKRRYKRGNYRTSARVAVVILMILSLERCFSDIICWVGIGYLLLWQASIFRKNTLLPLMIYATLFVILGVFFLFFADKKRSEYHAGVIAIKRDDNDSAETTVIRKVVKRLARLTSGSKKYNPRFARIMRAVQVLKKQKSGRRVVDKDASVELESPASISSPAVDDKVQYEEKQRGDGVDESEGIDDNISLNYCESNDSLDSNQIDEVLRRCSAIKNGSDHLQNPEITLNQNASSNDLSALSDCGDCRKAGKIDDSNNSNFLDYDDNDDMRSKILTANKNRRSSIRRKWKENHSQEILDPPQDKRSENSDLQLRTNNLSIRIRRNRSAIRRMWMENQTRDITDSFVINTQIHRDTLKASRGRARDKLQKRLEEKDSRSTADKNDSDKIRSGSSEQKKQIYKNSNMSSFEVFDKKVKMVTRYTGHEAMRERSLESQRQAAAISLQRKFDKKKVGEGKEQ